MLIWFLKYVKDFILNFLINRSYQGCQFEVRSIQCQTLTDVLRIVNEFAHNYFQYVFNPQLVIKT